MAFTVQNILKYPLNFLGNIILPEGKLDLLTLYSVDEVKTLLLYGELYNYIMGRSLTIVNPNADVYQLGLTYEQHSLLTNAGFFKGYTGAEILKDAFTFTADGYLKVDLQDANISVTATVDLTGLATAGNQDDAYALLQEVLAEIEKQATETTLISMLSVDMDAYSVSTSILSTVATSSNQTTLYAKTADAYSVENAINTKLDLLSTSAKQDLLYTKTADAYSVEVAINTKLPTTLGQKTSANSLAVVLSSDAYIQLSTPENSYQNIRTFVNTVADTEPPTTGFVSLANATSCGFAEFIWDIRSVGGTVAPTTVRFKIWNRVNTTVVKMDEFTFPASYLTLSQSTNPLKPRAYPCNSDEVYVTVSFDDGTSPTIVDGYIYARATTACILERNLYIRNLDTGHQIIETRSYDGSSDTLKVTPSYVSEDLYLEELLCVDTTGLTIVGGEVFYPSADGVLLGSYRNIAFEYSLIAANDGYIQAYWESTLGTSSWTQRNIVTLDSVNAVTGVKSATTPIVSTQNGTISGLIYFTNINTTRIRMAVKPLIGLTGTGTSGAVKLSIRRML